MTCHPTHKAKHTPAEGFTDFPISITTGLLSFHPYMLPSAFTDPSRLTDFIQLPKH